MTRQPTGLCNTPCISAEFARPFWSHCHSPLLQQMLSKERHQTATGPEDLTWALAEIAQYFMTPPEPGTAEADRFDVLANLIEEAWLVLRDDPQDLRGLENSCRDLDPTLPR
ncbi:hypothetical protein [Salipiger aestuarii]|uniref:hypothetical protein n=1 Tax=Salipiger aestuarii TaxID=568098 RepID=UPI001CC2CACC|nr:hypothetical protein [Salipiger aestuarii]